jgi:hypothetical protein
VGEVTIRHDDDDDRDDNNTNSNDVCHVSSGSSIGFTKREYLYWLLWLKTIATTPRIVAPRAQSVSAFSYDTKPLQLQVICALQDYIAF